MGHGREKIVTRPQTHVKRTANWPVGGHDTVAYRAAPSRSGFTLRVAEAPTASALALEVVEAPAAADAQSTLTPVEKVAGILAQANGPLPIAAIRDRCRISTAGLCEAFDALLQQGRARKTAEGYAFVRASPPVSRFRFPRPLTPAGKGKRETPPGAPLCPSITATPVSINNRDHAHPRKRRLPMPVPTET